MSSGAERALSLSAANPRQRVRIVTAASLFDGHDAAINIMRRILQAQGAEVIHLGHDRSVEEIAMAAVQEDVHAVAVSSYQGGHMEFFRYLVDRLAELGAPHVRVYGPDEIERLGFIQRLKQLGLSLAEIKELNAVYGIGGSTRAMLARLDELLERHRQDVADRIAGLTALRGDIERYREHVGRRIEALEVPRGKR